MILVSFCLMLHKQGTGSCWTTCTLSQSTCQNSTNSFNRCSTIKESKSSDRSAKFGGRTQTMTMSTVINECGRQCKISRSKIESSLTKTKIITSLAKLATGKSSAWRCQLDRTSTLQLRSDYGYRQKLSKACKAACSKTATKLYLNQFKESNWIQPRS